MAKRRVLNDADAIASALIKHDWSKGEFATSFGEASPMERWCHVTGASEIDLEERLAEALSFSRKSGINASEAYEYKKTIIKNIAFNVWGNTLRDELAVELLNTEGSYRSGSKSL